MSANDDRDLLMTLAQACGWTCTPGRIFTTEGYWVTDKDDGVTGASFGHTEEEAWQHAEFPDWLHSADAALALPWPPDRRVNIKITTNGVRNEPHYIVELTVYGETVSRYQNSIGYTLARALCECFAQWWRAKEKQP